MEKQGIILQDKFFALGESPIYNESQDIVGNVAYKLSIANKFEILKPDLDKWEGIAVVQGVRMMVKDENSSTATAPAQ
ncbi:hypothetical protein [Priestia aryabhattai]|uniref:hypothetical protein n=1 Tax=Priestia aryabhattai TaxID=412384 RepID=UPI0023806CCA|nr:hypothetical protein [Priestia aryabhattai]WDW11341.1 hypothetical protein PWC21_12465 [Priestia aryabhattai]